MTEAAAAATTASTETTAATAAAATATAAAAAAKPWHDGVITDAEMIGYIQNKGWHDKPANETLKSVITSFRELEKMRGVPAEELVRFPKEATHPDWQKVYDRLGVPKDASGYDLSNVKFADGTELDEGFVTLMKQTAANLKLPKDAAPEIAKAVVKFMTDAEANEATERSGAIAAAKARLATNWGNNHEANMFVAKQAALKLGVQPAEINALENTIGYDRVMEMFRSLGQRMGEDKFVAGTPGLNDGVMTREQAISRKRELMADPEWVARANRGGEKSREWQQISALDAIIAASDETRRMRM